MISLVLCYNPMPSTLTLINTLIVLSSFYSSILWADWANANSFPSCQRFAHLASRSVCRQFDLIGVFSFIVFNIYCQNRNSIGRFASLRVLVWRDVCIYVHKCQYLSGIALLWKKQVNTCKWCVCAPFRFPIRVFIVANSDDDIRRTISDKSWLISNALAHLKWARAIFVALFAFSFKSFRVSSVMAWKNGYSSACLQIRSN